MSIKYIAEWVAAWIYTIWFLIFKKKPELATAPKRGGIEPNWYPPTPAPPAIIAAHIVALPSHSDLFKQVIDKETRSHVKVKREVLSDDKMNKAIQLGAKRFFKEAYLDREDNDVLITAGWLDLKEYMMDEFFNVFQSSCNQFGIKVSFRHKAIWAKRDQLKSVFDKGFNSEQPPEIDEAMRKLLQTGPYR